MIRINRNPLSLDAGISHKLAQNMSSCNLSPLARAQTPPILYRMNHFTQNASFDIEVGSTKPKA